jgi:hypothetical protein
MKNFRQFCATLILTLALAFAAFAGEIGFPGTNTTPPPEPDSSITEETELSDETSTVLTSTSGIAAIDPTTEAALSVIRSLLLFF